jgi:hypothetical protein
MTSNTPTSYYKLKVGRGGKKERKKKKRKKTADLTTRD